jgi:hypothetical protein
MINNISAANADVLDILLFTLQMIITGILEPHDTGDSTVGTGIFTYLAILLSTPPTECLYWHAPSNIGYIKVFKHFHEFLKEIFHISYLIFILLSYSSIA